MTKQILIVDQNNLLRQGLRALLSNSTEFNVAGEASDGRSGVNLALTLQPDIVLMEITLPGMSGMEVTARIKQRLPEVRVIILTALRSDEHLRESLRMGADGYLLKDASYEELLSALRSVALGHKYLSPDMSGHLVEGFLHPGQAAADASPLSLLNSRERSVLQLIAEGRTNRSTAEYLSISPKTVEKYRARLMHKLHLRNAAELMLVALEIGLITRPGSLSSRLMEETGGPTASPAGRLPPKAVGSRHDPVDDDADVGIARANGADTALEVSTGGQGLPVLCNPGTNQQRRSSQ
jgi:DNA-binding NarL/FixJ family response regulator